MADITTGNAASVSPGATATELPDATAIGVSLPTPIGASPQPPSTGNSPPANASFGSSITAVDGGGILGAQSPQGAASSNLPLIPLQPPISQSVNPVPLPQPGGAGSTPLSVAGLPQQLSSLNQPQAAPQVLGSPVYLLASS